jgi:hypothetical protein
VQIRDYRLIVEGELSDETERAFEGMMLVRGRRTTILVGPIRQAHLQDCSGANRVSGSRWSLMPSGAERTTVGHAARKTGVPERGGWGRPPLLPESSHRSSMNPAGDSHIGLEHGVGYCRVGLPHQGHHEARALDRAGGSSETWIIALSRARSEASIGGSWASRSRYATRSMALTRLADLNCCQQR